MSATGLDLSLPENQLLPERKHMKIIVQAFLNSGGLLRVGSLILEPSWVPKPSKQIEMALNANISVEDFVARAKLLASLHLFPSYNARIVNVPQEHRGHF